MDRHPECGNVTASIMASRPGAREARANLRNPELSVAEVMRTDFRSCNAFTLAAAAATAMHQSGCPLLAVTRSQVPIGVVTEYALTSALAEHGGDLSQRTAGDLVIEATTVPIEAPIREAADRLAGAGGHLLAVDRDQVLKGVVTLAELAPQVSEAAIGRLLARIVEGRQGRAPSVVVGLTGSPGLRPTSAEAARADPTAEIKPTKSQAQPHPWDSPTGAHSEPVPRVSPSDLINPMLKVSDAMTAGPRTCSRASSALEAVLVFRDGDCGVIPVTHEGRPVGVVTDRDIALALADHQADLASTPLEALMTPDVITIAADASLDEATELLGGKRLRRLLVIDADGRLVGVLSWTDLVPHLSERGLGHVVSRIVRGR
jgi:CBS domain-containing protein